MLINLTPHEVVLHLPGESVIELVPSGQVARVEIVETQTAYGRYWDRCFSLRAVRLGEPYGLPEPQPGVIYVASSMVAQAAARLGRADVFAPDTDRAQRDEQGRILSVPGLVTWSQLPEQNELGVVWKAP